MKTRWPAMLALLAGAFLLFHLGDDLGRWAMGWRSAPDDVAWLRMEFEAGKDQAEQLASMQDAYRRRSAAIVQSVEDASLRLASGIDRSGAWTETLRSDLSALETARAR